MVVRLEPAGQSLVVSSGSTLMSAANASGYRWPSVCGGFAICGACAVQVSEGDCNAVPPTQLEVQRLAELHSRTGSRGRPVRLACQMVPTGPMTVFKVGVRKPE